MSRKWGTGKATKGPCGLLFVCEGEVVGLLPTAEPSEFFLPMGGDFLSPSPLDQVAHLRHPPGQCQSSPSP